MKQFLITLLLLSLYCTVYSQANTKLSNLVSPTAANQSLLPSSSNTKDLGSSSLNWRSLYLKGSWFKGSQRFLSNSGIGNTFLGIQSGTSNTSGTYNTIVGYSALRANTTGEANNAFGAFALYSNIDGYENTAIGRSALYYNTSGYRNSATGTYALYSNTSGHSNTANGSGALYFNTTGSFNTAQGDEALVSNTTGISNTAQGDEALYRNTTGSDNTAQGASALYHNTSGYRNTAIGTYALNSNTTGNSNTAQGYVALIANTMGSANTAQGSAALTKNTESYNSAFGFQALGLTTASQYNTAVGYNAGFNYNNGYNNVFVGANTDVNGNGYYNVIAIGQGTICTAPSQARFGNPATSAYYGYAGWTNISDGRYKKNIKEDVPGLSFITKLRPITYTLDASGLDAFLNKGKSKEAQPSGEAQAIMQKALKEKEAIIQTGFVAQEVEKAAKESGYDFSGVDKPKNANDLYGLRYSEFVVPLVKAVQELEGENTALKAQVTNLNERLNKLEAAQKGNNLLTLNSSSLEQNTPNPVNGTTHIGYHIPETIASARLDLTNAKGQLVKTMNLSKGSSQVSFDTAMLASGTYNYTLYVDGKQVDTKRLIIGR